MPVSKTTFTYIRKVPETLLDTLTDEQLADLEWRVRKLISHRAMSAKSTPKCVANYTKRNRHAT